MVSARDRLKAKFTRVILVGGALEARREWGQTALIFARALELDT